MNVEHLARQSLPEVELSESALDEIVHLARRITQIHAERRGVVQDIRSARPYEACDPHERAAMRLGALRVVQSLYLLGYLSSPSNSEVILDDSAQ